MFFTYQPDATPRTSLHFRQHEPGKRRLRRLKPVERHKLRHRHFRQLAMDEAVELRQETGDC
jgi:hypothetical protein